MSIDFKARQIRVNKIVNSGSNANDPLLIYGLGAATNQQGGINPTHFPGLGSDVWLYVSGTRGAADSSYGAVAFRGDVVVSGSLQVGDSVLPAPSTPPLGKGTIYSRTGSLYYKNSVGNEFDLTATSGGSVAGLNTHVQFNNNGAFGAKPSFTFATGSNRLTVTHASAISVTASYISPASSLVIKPQGDASEAGSDTFFFVSGSELSDVAVFGGRVVSSGSIRIKDTGGLTQVVLNPGGIVSGSGDFQVGGLIAVDGNIVMNGNTVATSAPIFNLVNANANVVNFAGAANIVNLGTSFKFTSSSAGTFNHVSKIESLGPNALALSGSTALLLGASSYGGLAEYIALVGRSAGRNGIFPATDSSLQQFDLGGVNRRWANVYTGDLHLKNDRGDYTLIEEEDFLSIRFNKTGKRYRFVVEPVPELDEK